MGMKNLFRTCYQRNFRIRNFSTASRVNSWTYEIGILGAPLHKGQRKSGVHHGPRAIRDGGLTDRMRHVGVTAADYGDLDFDQSETSNVHKTSFEVGYASPIFNLEFVAKATRMVSEKVSQIVKSRDVCLTLGGDHSIGIGTVHGHANVNPDLGVIWVDAHPDLNLPQTTPSGNLHGMALAMVLKECENNTKDIPGFEWLKSRVSASRVGFIGLREIDDGEAALLRKLNICHFSIRDIDRNGIALCMEQMLDILNPTGRRPLHVSYDIDSIDPSIAPSTGTPVMGGLTYREALYIAEEIARTGCMRAMDLVEVNPKLGSEDNSLTTARIAVDVIAHALGLEIRGVQKKKTFMDREEDDTKIILQTRTLPDDFKDSLPNDLIAKTSK